MLQLPVPVVPIGIRNIMPEAAAGGVEFLQMLKSVVRWRLPAIAGELSSFIFNVNYKVQLPPVKLTAFAPPRSSAFENHGTCPPAGDGRFDCRRRASSASNFFNVSFTVVFDDEVNGCLTRRSKGAARPAQAKIIRKGAAIPVGPRPPAARPCASCASSRSRNLVCRMATCRARSQLRITRLERNFDVSGQGVRRHAHFHRHAENVRRAGPG